MTQGRSSQAREAWPAPGPSDVFIAIMGVTGTGKSSFVSKLAPQSGARIGHHLRACTKRPHMYTTTLGYRKVHLIDTPGFDDTSRSDTEVLRELATWLAASYQHSIKLNGIIYLHRVTDVRMQGSAKRNLFMFRKLCGQDALKNVILATTMWDRIEPSEGEARERELIATPEYWGWMQTQGSTVFRYTGSLASAHHIIGFFLEKAPTVLDIQQQMVDDKKAIYETSAGRALDGHLDRERQRWADDLRKTQQQMQEAIQARDAVSKRMLEDVQRENRQHLARLKQDQEKLRTSTEEMHREKYAQLEARLQKQLQRGIERNPPAKFVDFRGFLRSRPGRNRVAERVYLALCEGRYCFLGAEEAFVFNEPVMPTPFSPASREGGWLALGEGGTWAERVFQDGRWQYGQSNNFHRRYPDLARIMDNPTSLLEYVSLGPHGQWFSRNSSQNIDWCIDDSLAHSLRAVRRQRGVEQLAFGRGGAYFCVKNGGGYKWNLKGCYPELDRLLRAGLAQCNSWIKAVALDMYSDDYVIVTAKSVCGYFISDDRARYAFEEFTTINFGCDFSKREE